jgi:hypothetical protein
MSVNIKIMPVETIPGIGGSGKIKENNRGVNSNMIHLIYF